MISSKLSAGRRGELLLFQGAIGSVLATVVTLFVVPALAHGNEMTYRRDLLWLGAAGLAISAIAALSVGPLRSTSNITRVSMRDTYRQGFAIARSQPWFRRYVSRACCSPGHPGHHVLCPAHRPSEPQLACVVSCPASDRFSDRHCGRVYRLFGAAAYAGQCPAQNGCRADRRGRIVRPVVPHLGVQHVFLLARWPARPSLPRRFRGSAGGRRIAPRNIDRVQLDAACYQKHGPGGALGGLAQTANHLAGCIVLVLAIGAAFASLGRSRSPDVAGNQVRLDVAPVVSLQAA